jgi:hypothetical protein
MVRRTVRRHREAGRRDEQGSWVTRREVTGCTPREHVNNLQPVSFLPGRVRSVML